MTIRDILKFKDGREIDVAFPIRLVDGKCKEVYYENSEGYCFKREYDADGNRTYYEDSYGFWLKCEYDANGKETYYEDSKGCWHKSEYDDNGNKVYFENSYGRKRGTPRKKTVTITVNGKSIEISRESAKALGFVK